MRPGTLRRWPIAAWSIAVISILGVFRPTEDGSRMFQISHQSVGLDALAGLLGLWVVFGRSDRRGRGCGLFSAATIVILGFSTFGEWPNYWYPLATEATQLATILVAGLLLWGGRAYRVWPAPRRGEPSPTPSLGSSRWSVRDLFLLIAAAAFLFAAVTRLKPWTQDFGRLPIQEATGVTLGFVAMATAWSLAGYAPWPLRVLPIAATLAANVLTQIYCYRSLHGFIDDDWYLGKMIPGTLLYFVMIAVPIWAYRQLAASRREATSGPARGSTQPRRFGSA